MARLASGIRKRANGTLEKRITVNGKQISIYGHSAAEISEKEKALAENNYKPAEKITLSEYTREWLARLESTVKPATISVYKREYDYHVKDELGKTKLAKIDKNMLLTFQRAKKDRFGVATANRVTALLTMIFKAAYMDEVITKNPMVTIKRLKDDKKEKASETIHRALTEEETKDFMNEMKSRWFYEITALMLCTGMRAGEASALTWGDIDYKQGVIHITKTVSKGKDGKMIISDSPKSSSSRRDIPLNDMIISILKSQREKRKLFSEIIPIENRIFSTTDGELATADNIDSQIQTALKRLDKKGKHIDKFTAHAFRDTFATRFLEQTGDLKTLQKILGHSSFTMTADLYAHVLENTKKEKMNILKIAW